MKLLVLILAGLCSNADRESLRSRVDLIELNHVYERGRLKFVQVIFYEWSPDYCRLDVCGWKFAPEVRIYRRQGGAIVRWLDRNTLQQCEVQAPRYLVTYTDHDREVEHRYLLPTSQRPCLFAQ